LHKLQPWLQIYEGEKLDWEEMTGLDFGGELNKGPEVSGRWPKFSRRFFRHIAWARAISTASIRSYAASSKKLEMRVALGKRSIRTFLRGLPRRCFKQRAGHNADLDQESTDSWLPRIWFNFLQATNRALKVEVIFFTSHKKISDLLPSIP
jgi:hypothetical protein